jgi:hypothetical protein
LVERAWSFLASIVPKFVQKKYEHYTPYHKEMVADREICNCFNFSLGGVGTVDNDTTVTSEKRERGETGMMTGDATMRRAACAVCHRE